MKGSSSMAEASSPAPVPVPVPEASGPGLTTAEWEAVDSLLYTIYTAKADDGFDLARVFRKMVNKRVNPEYYQIIKEPIALSQVKEKVKTRAYRAFSQFTHDLARIWHNAQVFNQPEARPFVDAVLLQKLVNGELGAFEKENKIQANDAKLPYLGEIPPPSPVSEKEERAAGHETGKKSRTPAPDEDDAKEDGAGEADEDEEDEDDTAAVKSQADGPSNGQESTVNRHGRPPRVDTPLDGRMKAILRGIRRPRDKDGDPLFLAFEKLPDKSELPEYYVVIKTPLCLDIIKKNMKRRRYKTIEAFMADVNLMFDNAKMFNEDDSQVFLDAVSLQKEAKRIADAQIQKPDDQFLLDDGRIPLPDGIDCAGERWKTGDWVLIRNKNDPQKPIPSQIHRTWQNRDGSHRFNACWFFRPEQTVHHVEKRFFEHEIVKTGQYRDHAVDEIEDRCFVMYITRFGKGRPRAFPRDKQVFVCEARYNEDQKRFNKIKTWSSCQPDEVRDADYEMDLFPVPVRLAKHPSPIRHLLAENASETDGLPSPTWGAENAPPVIGAVHRRPREPNDSPPPSPSPPPAVPIQPPRHRSSSRPGPASLSNPTPAPTSTPLADPNNPTKEEDQSRLHPHPRPFNLNLTTTTTTTTTTSTPSHLRPRHPQPQPSERQHPGPSRPRRSVSPPSYHPPAPADVYRLSEAENAAVPGALRERYLRDGQGRVLMFASPPLVHAVGGELGVEEEGEVRHSEEYVRVLEGRREEEEQRKRKERENERKRKRVDGDGDGARMGSGGGRGEAARIPREKAAVLGHKSEMGLRQLMGRNIAPETRYLAVRQRPGQARFLDDVVPL